jgi:hypothetical protein
MDRTPKVGDNGSDVSEVSMKTHAGKLLIFALAVVWGISIQADQPLDAQLKLEDLASAMQGSAASTRRRILETFRQDLEGATVRFTGTVWTLSPVSLNQPQNDGPDIRPSLFSWEYQGLRVKGDPVDPSVAPETPTARTRRRLGGATEATLIILRSGKYQLYALTASPQIIDHLRQGATITLDAQITGLLEDSLLGFVTGVLETEVRVRCPNGHQLPPDNDFKFCPYCGAPLIK